MCFPYSLFVEMFEVTAINCILCPWLDSAGAARSDPAAGWSDSPAPGPAGSAPADHHPATPGSHHRWTEPGFKFWPVESANAFNQIIINMITECLPSLLVVPQGQQISVQGQQVAQTADGQTIVYQPVNADGTVLQQGKTQFSPTFSVCLLLSRLYKTGALLSCLFEWEPWW